MTYKKCRCPVWMFGSVSGKRVRRSLDTVSWERAEEFLRDTDPDESHERITVTLAGDRFIADCESRNLGKETIAKYKLLTKELSKLLGTFEVKKVTLDDLATYRESWALAPISSRKKLERVRTFFRFCEERGWLRNSPATKLKAPVVKASMKRPFSDAETEKIVWAADQYPELYPMSGEYGKKVKPFVLLLQHSGLRIRDAVCLRTDAVKNGKIFVQTQKTGSQVWIPLPTSVVDALDGIRQCGDFYFWSGRGLPKSAVADWQRTMSRVFRNAGVAGSPHMFRHTFATKLLQKGVSTEIVARLLGHQDIKITQKHYSHWIAERQLELEAAVKKTWA